MENDNLTVTLIDGWRVPCYHPSVFQQDFSFMDDGKITISTGREEEDCFNRQKRESTLCDEEDDVFTCCTALSQVSRCHLTGF